MGDTFKDAGPGERSVYDRTGLPEVAAIARMGAGDGLVAQATAALEGVTDGPWEEVSGDVYAAGAGSPLALTPVYHKPNARFIAFARQWVPEAAAHIAALTAQVAENRISEPHDPGDFVGDIFYGHPIKTTMGTHRWTGTERVALPSEAEALAGLLAEARKEAAALRERVAKLVEAAEGLSAILDKHETKGPLPDVAMMLCWLAAQNIRAVLRGNILEKPE